MPNQRVTFACQAAGAMLLLMLPSSVCAWQLDSDSGVRPGPIVEIHQTVGDGVGFENGYFSTNAFVPLFRQSNNGLLFSDLQINALYSEPVSANLGLGYRFYSDDLERVFGIYNYYDYRESHGFNFKQITTGLEVLGENHDIRATAYMPSLFSDQMSSADKFVGNSLLIDRFAVPLHGFDVEAGFRIPLAEQYETKVFAGSYFLTGDGVSDVWGWKTRIESRASNTLRLKLAVQSDPLNGTTVNAGFALRFPTSGLSGLSSSEDFGDRILKISPRRLGQRLTDPVHRMRNIVITEQPGTVARHPNAIGPFAAPNPKAGQPIVFHHVAAGHAGDGSASAPHATLEAALADPAYQASLVDVVYVRSNTDSPVVHTGNITNLVAETSILSNGPIQQVQTQAGFRQLPHSGVDPLLRRLPQIAGSVALADNTRLSGFNIQRGITGTTVSGVNVLSNRISNSGGDGIQLMQIGSLVSNATDGDSVDLIAGVKIENNMIDVTNGSGISLEVTGYTDNVVIGKNAITNSGGSGILIEGSDYGAFLAGLDPRDTRNRAGIEIGLTRIATTDGHGVEFSGDQFTKNSQVQISDGNIQVTGNNFDGVRIGGDSFEGRFQVVRSSQNLFNSSVGRITSSGGEGVHLTSPDFGGLLLFGSNSLIEGQRALAVDGQPFVGAIVAISLVGAEQEFSGLSDVAIELRNLAGDYDPTDMVGVSGLIFFEDVILSSNSPSGTDFIADFIGPGTKRVVLSNNVSTNPLAADDEGPFNFDLRFTGNRNFERSIDSNIGSIGINGTLLAP